MVSHSGIIILAIKRVHFKGLQHAQNCPCLGHFGVPSIKAKLTTFFSTVCSIQSNRTWKTVTIAHRRVSKFFRLQSQLISADISSQLHWRSSGVAQNLPPNRFIPSILYDQHVLHSSVISRYLLNQSQVNNLTGKNNYECHTEIHIRSYSKNARNTLRTQTLIFKRVHAWSPL